MLQPLPPGTTAPDFELLNQADQPLRLSSLRGRLVVLAFYPLDWSPTCTDQLSVYQQALPRFEELGAQLIGISVDSRYSHTAFAEARDLTFPLLADFHPKAAVAQLYGTYREDKGYAGRTVYVIDADGVITFSNVAAAGTFQPADLVLAEVEKARGQAVTA